MAVPGDLPLENSLVTCITCHAAEEAGHTARPANSVPRSISTPANLCAKCHVASDTGRAAAHGSGLDRAHYGSASVDRSDRSGTLDAESRACVTCHDGSAAGEAGLRGAIAMPSDLGREHPVGVRFASAHGGAWDGPRLHPARALDPRIRLFNGALGCGSCHSPYSREPRLLVVNNSKSALCLSCHAE